MKLKGLQWTDLLVGVLLVVVIAVDMDFANLQTLDYALIGASAFWVLALIVRLYIANK